MLAKPLAPQVACYSGHLKVSSTLGLEEQR